MKNKNLPFFVTLAVFVTSCNLKDQKKKQELAFKNAEYIMENLNKKSVINQFPPKYFQKEQTISIIDKVAKECDWENRKGGYKNSFTSWGNNKTITAFTYEYYLLCDTLRFKLSYKMDSKKPELIQVDVNPI